MLPPQWAVRDSRRFTLQEFGERFTEAWARMRSRFLKLECWQAYRELEGNTSQSAYDRGEVDRARDLLRHEAEADRPLYEDIKTRHVDYARIRLVQEPLTHYLEYELIAYRIRAEMGEDIEIVRCGKELKLPNEDYFDFLLFDRHTALIHDYGDDGLQRGGWIAEDAEVIVTLEKIATRLRAAAVPLHEFLTTRNT